MSGSPKRFGYGVGWNKAPSPSAPTCDMTNAELTHAYQHLAAQAALDKAWAKLAEGAITAGDAILHQVDRRLKQQFDAAPTAAMA